MLAFAPIVSSSGSKCLLFFCEGFHPCWSSPLAEKRREKKITKTLNPHVLFRCVKIFLKREYKLINTKRVMMCKFRTPDDDDDVVDKNESTV